jgi:opacity protein-like surface antigen
MKNLLSRGLLALAAFLSVAILHAQDEDDLLGMLEDDDYINYTTASFKANRVINLHSLENTAAGVLDFKISHRFGRVNGGVKELYGLDQSTIRFGFEYGITDVIMVGLGRSSFEKTYDGFFKYKFLRQSSGGRNMPISALLFSSAVVKTNDFADPERVNYFTSRMYYTFQLILGRKFSENLSIQLSPTLVHRNLVATAAETNDVLALGAGGRYKLSKRFSVNAEYIYVLPNQVSADYHNSLSLGVDIETGGHVFQLHFTNSLSMIEKGYITETTGQWEKGDIHFGFNVSRVFTIKEKHH